MNSEILSLKEKLFHIIKNDCLFFGDFTLSSGRKSSYYIDARKLTLSSPGLLLVAKLFFEVFPPREVEAVGGPTIGADPIVGAILALSQERGREMKGFLVRPEGKEHGMGSTIEGLLLPGLKAVVLDDVVTGGASILRAAQFAREKGLLVDKAFSIVDRGEGGKGFLKKSGIELFSIFAVTDFLE